jgi:hypothetical protein
MRSAVNVYISYYLTSELDCTLVTYTVTAATKSGAKYFEKKE